MIIAVASGKGGTDKASVAVSLALSLTGKSHGSRKPVTVYAEGVMEKILLEVWKNTRTRLLEAEGVLARRCRRCRGAVLGADDRSPPLVQDLLRGREGGR